MTTQASDTMDRKHSYAAEMMYLTFLSMSVACRSIETGIVSALLPNIGSDLHLSYTREGAIAASPDYGMIPGAMLAGLVFTYINPSTVLRITYIYIACCSMTFAYYPTFEALVFTRATTSFFWSMAVVHYPVWISSHGSEEKRTRMLALPSIMLLVGLGIGYVGSGRAYAHHAATWQQLYGLTGCLMAVIAIASCLIPPSLVNDVDYSARLASLPGPPSETQPLIRSSRLTSLVPQPILDLLSCRLYLFVVAVASCVSGAAGFVLYFFTEFGTTVTGWSQSNFNSFASVLMVTSALGGTVGGAEFLTRIGGYQNYNNALLMIFGCGSAVLASGFCIQFGAFSGSIPVDVIGFFGILFFASFPTAAFNGIAVSVVPSAKHYASGLQFGGLHIAKMVVPSIGGVVIDHIGLISGFCFVTTTMGALMALSGLAAYSEFKYNSDLYEQPK